MFRERPLTWLFILATVVVDLAMFFGAKGRVFEGIIMGQVAAIANWAAIGQTHRLTRGSILVVAVGVMATLPGLRSFEFYSRTLTIMAAYALVVVATSLIIVWIRNRVRIRFGGDYVREPLKIPLIEFFGWTIVVAIASFGIRHMDIGFLGRAWQFPVHYQLTYAVVPIALLLFNSRFRKLHLLRAVLFIGSVYLIAVFLLSRGWFVVEVTSVAAYLTAWLLVRSIEFDQLKTAEEDEDTEEQNEEIKLFDAEQ